MSKKLNTPRIVGLLLCLLVIALLFIFKDHIFFLPFLVISLLVYLLYYVANVKVFAKKSVHSLYVISLFIITFLVAGFFSYYSIASNPGLTILNAILLGMALNTLIWGEKAWWKP